MAVYVALRKESVDRNNRKLANFVSLNTVALRKESVDRNDIAELTAHLPLVSLSARRAWIEICLLGCCARLPGRSPQGERG